MKLVVADTSPVFYLLSLGSIDVLPVLFGTIMLPEAVRDELCHSGAPQAVRMWAQNLPSWVVTRNVTPSDDLDLQSLGSGEQAAIALALSLKADMILIDERKGAAVALKKGSEVMGTLGIFDRAAERGLIDLAQMLEHLKITNFRYRPEMLDALLAKHARSEDL